VPLQRFSVDFQGLEVPASVSGEGERVLVCVNPAQTTMAAWRGLISVFHQDTTYRLVLFDFPNQGTRASLTEAQDLADQAEVVHAVVQHVSPDTPVDMLGCSWGAVVPAKYASEHPSCVRRLMLGSFNPGFSPMMRELAPMALEILDRQDRPAIAEVFIRLFCGGLSDAYHDNVRRQFAHLAAGDLAQMRLQIEEILSGRDTRAHIDYGRITARVMIVNGSDDPIISEADNQLIREILPKAELRVLDNVGHFLHVQRASIIDDYIGFIRRRSSTFMAIPDEALEE